MAMTSRQLRKLLKDMDLSQTDTANELDLNVRTMRRYCAGVSPIPTRAEYAFRWLAHLREQARKRKRVRRPKAPANAEGLTP